MNQYASRTSISAEKSRAEIERILTRCGADQFFYGWEIDTAVVAFRMSDRRVQFRMRIPSKDVFATTPAGLTRDAAAQERAFQQAGRQRWRALAMIIRAKLEAVESGVAEFEDEFLSHIILPHGETVGEWLRPQLAISYSRGEVPPLLPAPEGRGDISHEP